MYAKHIRPSAKRVTKMFPRSGQIFILINISSILLNINVQYFNLCCVSYSLKNKSLRLRYFAKKSDSFIINVQYFNLCCVSYSLKNKSLRLRYFAKKSDSFIINFSKK